MQKQTRPHGSFVLVHTNTSDSRLSSSGYLVEELVSSDPAIVVMPLDASEHSTYAVYFYLRYIHRPVNKVFICYVAESLDDYKKQQRKMTSNMKWSCCPWLSFDKVVVDVGPSPGMVAEMERKDTLNYHKIKSSVKRLFAANNVNTEFRYLCDKDPATAITDFRKEVGGTLIVMGSRGEGTFHRHIFGSVSEKVLHNALVPVLVVKKPHGAMTTSQMENQVTVIH